MSSIGQRQATGPFRWQTPYRPRPGRHKGIDIEPHNEHPNRRRSQRDTLIQTAHAAIDFPVFRYHFANDRLQRNFAANNEPRAAISRPA